MTKKSISIQTLCLSLLSAGLLVACGTGTSSDRTMMHSNSESGYDNSKEGGIYDRGSRSNIPYLRANHDHYSEYGSTQIPTPTKDAGTKSINWIIAADTQEDAVRLQEHLSFMEKQLLDDRNPRGWDKLFLMEAYMKYHALYTTSVERDAKTVIVSKNAKTICAYQVISAHSDAVSNDFFAKGDIMNDYSAIAEHILAGSACDDVRASLEAYIAQRQRGGGMHH